FKEIMYRARAEAGSMRAQSVIKYVLKNPFGMAWEVLKNPKPYFESFKHIFIQRNKYNVDYERDELKYQKK
ncbi:MAG: hypothetical protein KKA19_08000, partial [Candidatus Margulisbacteria bacterium]|nr:hypothetical protein [Candidatus Margulisiibacteriota bacterium]